MSHSHEKKHDHSGHSHSHDHDHHSHGVTNISFAFFCAIAVNIVFVAIEAFFGFRIHSLALLSDAGHNAMDVLSLIISGVAIWASRFQGTETFTYGYRRASMLATLVNAVLLIATASFIIIEAIDRISKPVETVGSTMMIVAAVGIIVNGLSGLLLMKWSKEDINVKSAYLHLLGDALVSFGVVIGGAIIYFTGYVMIDPIISIVVSVIMIGSVVGLLKKAVRMNFDGVPAELNISEIKKELIAIPGVADIHHIHVWSLSTTENALTAHVIVEVWVDEKKIKAEIRHKLASKSIAHSTLETEYETCENEHCNHQSQ